MQVAGRADNQASDFLHPERIPAWADAYRPQMRYRGFGRAVPSLDFLPVALAGHRRPMEQSGTVHERLVSLPAASD